MSKLFLIGNSHLDPVWLWRWQEGFSEILATFRSALDRMKDFPDFKFTSACAVYYQWVEKIDPQMFAEIQQRVKEGRWSIVGGWFLQPDCNIPCGESYARHALLSQRYFNEKFGVSAKTGYNVDSFGHNANLPKILKNSGMENYVFMRPMPHETDVAGDLFLWESDDGSQLCTYRIPWFYNLNLSTFEKFGELKEKIEKNQMDYMAFFGVGNHGGGPTIQLIDAINQADLGERVYATTDEYFDHADKTKLDVVKTELQHHARGCYSVNSFVKTYNRKCEQNLLATEVFCVMAKELAGFKYPQKKLNKGWKNLMFNQFHDILAGCCIKKAYDDAAVLYGETLSITEQEMHAAMQKIAWNINTLQGETLPAYKDPGLRRWVVWEHEVLGTPIVVFNSHPWPVRMPVEITAYAKKVTDNHNEEIPFQIIRGPQTNEWDKECTAFIAEVPAMGYRVYRVFVEKESEEVFTSSLWATDRTLENSRIKIELDAITGDIKSFYDKETNKYVINSPCKAVLVDETDADTWAHNKEKLGCTVGAFGKPEFSVIEAGNVRAAVRVITRYGDSLLQRDYTITQDSNQVNVKVKVDFHEKHKALKFTFPLTEEKVVAQIPYGIICRKGYTGEEPFGAWLSSGGLCVANDSKHGYDTEDGKMRMTVLRGAIYADHFGQRDEFCEYMDMGIHEFEYSVFPYENPIQAEKKAAELNFGLRTVVDTFHEGALPEEMSCLTCDRENVFISAVKQAEDEDGNIIRFHEMNGIDTEVTLQLFDKEIRTNVTHHALKTVHETGKELNLIEWE